MGIFGEEYIEEEVKKKVKSMKQLDRIEFLSKINLLQNGVGSVMNALVTLQVLGFVILLFGINFLLRVRLLRMFELYSLSNTYLAFGLLSITVSLFIVVSSFYLFFKSEKAEKEAKKRLEQFLKEKSK